MKNLSILALIAFSSVSYGAELCGTLTSYTRGPVCKPGKACPHFITLQYAIANESGKKTDIGTGDNEVFSQFNELKGQAVCAEGSRSGKTFEVTAIRARE